MEGMRVLRIGRWMRAARHCSCEARGVSRLTDLMRHTVENLKHNADLNGCGEVIDTAAVDWNFEKTWPGGIALNSLSVPI